MGINTLSEIFMRRWRAFNFSVAMGCSRSGGAGMKAVRVASRCRPLIPSLWAYMFQQQDLAWFECPRADPKADVMVACMLIALVIDYYLGDNYMVVSNSADILQFTGTRTELCVREKWAHELLPTSVFPLYALNVCVLSLLVSWSPMWMFMVIIVQMATRCD